MGPKKVFLVGAQLSRERVDDFLAASALVSIGASTTLAEIGTSLCEVRGDECPDILLLDIGDPLGDDEIAMLGAIRAKQPAMKVVVLGDQISLALLWQAHSTGIDGYLLRAVPLEMLAHALDLITSGQRILPPCSPASRLAVQLAPEAPMGATATIGLSAREAQVLRLLVAGSSNKAIARDLAISHETVKVHMRAVLHKLRARNRTQAALWGLEHGFVLPPALGRDGVGASEAVADPAAAPSVVDAASATAGLEPPERVTAGSG
jgi:two-component system, NarL family, nitrate/nitrite response regulator NarL